MEGRLTKSERIDKAEKEVGCLSDVKEKAEAAFIEAVLTHADAKRKLQAIWEEPEDE